VDWTNGLPFLASAGTVLFVAMFRPSLGRTQPSFPAGHGSLLLNLKWPGHEVEHFPASSANVLSPAYTLHSMMLNQEQGRNFTLPFAFLNTTG
jgi:hypothetical protein